MSLRERPYKLEMLPAAAEAFSELQQEVKRLKIATGFVLDVIDWDEDNVTAVSMPEFKVCMDGFLRCSSLWHGCRGGRLASPKAAMVLVRT